MRGSLRGLPTVCQDATSRPDTQTRAPAAEDTTAQTGGAPATSSGSGRRQPWPGCDLSGGLISIVERSSPSEITPIVPRWTVT